MRRLAVTASSLALVGALAAAPAPTTAAVPAHRLDVMIKLPGAHPWTGKGGYGRPARQQVTGVLRTTPGRIVAVVRIVNTGSRTTALDISASSIRVAFYGGADWPEPESLAPGESVTFRYTAHRGSAEDGDSMPVDITVPGDGVRFLLVAR
ncbi:hypothetical protein [Nocardioides sp.]|uniref:hypothetical protein n=1 Tax=Nocardioides sp. TaxID=35761 RepID=UPI00378315FB